MTLLDARGNPLSMPEPAKAPPTLYSGASAVAAFDMPLWRVSSDPSKMFKELQALYRHPWIHLAESTITNKLVGLPWHLEDENEDEVDDDSPPELVAIRDLLEQPQAQVTGRAQMTRRALWGITSRHGGLCGNGTWYLDNLDLLAATPTSMLYINPCRLTPVEDKAGHQIGWLLDSSSYDATDGTPLELSEVLHFEYDPPDWGHWGVGVAESALMKARLSDLGDRHAAGLLSSGGRLAGMLMPKTGVTLEPESWQSLVRDYRSITEDPNAAKRMQILKYPMEFVTTSATPEQIDLTSLMKMNRDDILALWRVPLTQVGIPAAAGIGANVRNFDEAVLMQGPVHDRVVMLTETIQYQLLDRWQKQGIRVTLVIEEPSFDDRTPQFDLITKAVNAPLTNDQRLALLGEDPLDPNVYGDLGAAIYLPTTLTRVDQEPAVPTDAGTTPAGPTPPTEAPPATEDPEADILLSAEELAGTAAAKATAIPKYVFGRLNPKYHGAAGAIEGLSAAENRARDAKVANSPFYAAYRKTHPRITPRQFRKLWLTARRSGPDAFAQLRTSLIRAFPPALRRRVESADRTKTRTTTPRASGGTRKLTQADIAGILQPAKASPLRDLRETVGSQDQPAVKRSVAAVLRAMRDEIAGRVRRHAAHLAKVPTDRTVWWDQAKWEKALRAALDPHAAKITREVAGTVRTRLAPAKAQPAGAFEDQVRASIDAGLGKRVTGIAEYTRDRVLATITQTVASGLTLSPAELGDKLEAALDDAAVFDEYRAEMIARTETGTILNEAALASYREYGVETVEITDGDGDELCAPWDHWIGPISDAPDALGHPNCTRDFIPVIGVA